MRFMNDKWMFIKIQSKQLVYISALLAVHLILTSTVAANEKNDFRHLIILGINKSVSNSEINPPSPVIGYYYIREDLSDDRYFQLTAKTTTVYSILGYKTENYFTGIKPVLNHTVYSAYHSYKDGVNDDSRCFKGNNSGAELFYEYSPVKNFKAGINYYPGYYFYQTKNKTDNAYSRQEATEVDLPENHSEHIAALNLNIESIMKKNVNRIKHGYFIEGIWQYRYRSGYGTFYDKAPEDNSSVNKSQKRYLTGGLYYNFINDINLMFDFTGAYNSGMDRNNSDQIGSYVADKGIMPGYFWGEFYHNKYTITRLQAGFPLFFWDSRIQPGFNVLYMPEKNDVTGVENYPRRIYRSISMELSVKAGNILPLFFNYVYGNDARRLNAGNGVNKKGNHELMFYMLAAI